MTEKLKWLDMWKTIGKKSISKRARCHYPHGFVCSAAMLVPAAMKLSDALCNAGIAVGVVWMVGFMIYEVTEDWRLKDGADLDIFGFLIGYAGGVAASVGLVHSGGSVIGLGGNIKDFIVDLVKTKIGLNGGIIGIITGVIGNLLGRKKK